MSVKKPSHEEEEFFAQVEEEKIKEQGDHAALRQAAQQAEQLRLAHWMHCPKCGNELTETRFRGMRIDQCGWCGGVYLDRAEFTKLAGHGEGVLHAVLGELLTPKG
ncbi:MAG: zf-TFIIB domain-containing protein [Deltaproteobacteria bacterium]|nr:zf-TFIIB domain-containing protein [Deltaproteobacteria bacterium]